jgi:glycosyltransferase involved in cell wall biosynthesis
MRPVTQGTVMVSGMKLGLGGVRTHLFLLCRLLLQQGVSLELYANGSHWSPSLVKELRQLGARLHLPPQPLWASPRLGMLYAALLWPLQIPQTASSLYCIGSGRSHLWLHRLKPRRVPSINHEIVDAPEPESLSAQCAQKLDLTVANSIKVTRLMKERWPDKPIRTVPFLTSDRPTPTPDRRRRVGNNVLRVTYLGRLVRHKRPDELVRRWRVLGALPELAPARLDIYGYDPTGQMLRELKAFVVESGQSRTISIHGEYETAALSQILAESDIVVLPSLVEGLPLVLVEAMLHGVPCVATAAGGTEELGEGNPDVIITSTEWSDFETGLLRMARQTRNGEVDPRRLHRWAEQRYGYSTVSRSWVQCLTRPCEFFDVHA